MGYLFESLLRTGGKSRSLTGISHTGVQFLYLNYQSDQLAAIFHTTKAGAAVTLRIQLEDLRTISFVHPSTGELLQARCTRDLGEQPYSLTRHQAALGLLRRTGGNPLFDVDLSRAQLAIDKEIAALSSSQNRKAIQRRLKAFSAVVSEGALSEEQTVSSESAPPARSIEPSTQLSQVEDVDSALELAYARRENLRSATQPASEQS